MKKLSKENEARRAACLKAINDAAEEVRVAVSEVNEKINDGLNPVVRQFEIRSP